MQTKTVEQLFEEIDPLPLDFKIKLIERLLQSLGIRMR